MQATRELVVLAGEFAARMQPAQDQLNRRNPFFRVDINRHPASIVDHFQRLIGMKNDLHAFRMASQCFIHTVINNFLARWLGRVVSVYIPGRRRTGSSPVSTSMASALYEDCVMVCIRRSSRAA